MTTCPECQLPAHPGESCPRALGRVAARSAQEIVELRFELARERELREASHGAADGRRWRGTLRG